MTRYIQAFIEQDLEKKMVFIGGPRQVGKTTLSKGIGQQAYKNYAYYNWDLADDRASILHHEWRADLPLIIFDELHKAPRWKQWIKGVYDTKPQEQQYLVTGSAKLNVYKKGGDSLLGRYHYWRLHPFTLDELPNHMDPNDAYQRLMTLGGFPEPFLSGDEREAKRWRHERLTKLVREDIRDLSAVYELGLLEHFIFALRERVSSLLVHSNLAQDLQVSPATTKNWLKLIEQLYIAFPIYPLTKQVPRAIQKPAKVYFYDNGDVMGDDGARLENLVATHFLKRLHFREDYYGEHTELRYIRDRNNREVDFVTIIDGQVDTLCEVKLSDEGVSPSLKYYAEKLQPRETVQIVASNRKPYDKNGIRVTNPIDYFSSSSPWRLKQS